jgi:hypothetical protein
MDLTCHQPFVQPAFVFLLARYKLLSPSHSYHTHQRPQRFHSTGDGATVTLDMKTVFDDEGLDDRTLVILANPGHSVAFFTRLRVL